MQLSNWLGPDKELDKDSVLAGSGWRFACDGVAISQVTRSSNERLLGQTHMYSCWIVLFHLTR